MHPSEGVHPLPYNLVYAEWIKTNHLGPRRGNHSLFMQRSIQYSDRAMEGPGQEVVPCMSLVRNHILLPPQRPSTPVRVTCSGGRGRPLQEACSDDPLFIFISDNRITYLHPKFRPGIVMAMTDLPGQEHWKKWPFILNIPPYIFNQKSLYYTCTYPGFYLVLFLSVFKLGCLGTMASNVKSKNGCLFLQCTQSVVSVRWQQKDPAMMGATRYYVPPIVELPRLL